MGFMDLSTSVASKKHVDFSDARYQGADKLRQSGKKNVRSTFTLYDNKEYNKTAVQDISAAYALSDKRLPIGEIMNKMVDLILDMEDGTLDTERDAVYTWKYSMALLNMYDDKSKRQDGLSTFDNGLKNSIVNSPLFIQRFPGRYTVRTNFFDPKIKASLVQDVVSTFQENALPRIHDVAIQQSKNTAEKHSNPILDRIVNWAVENYGCEVDSFYDVSKDERTQLFYSTNTIILHLKNGYDMSIIGYVGTDHDDKFAISIFDAHDIAIERHGERINQNEIKNAMTEAAAKDPVDPLTKLLSMERKKSEILKQQYEILSNIRPMIPAEALEIQAAESVVGKDYIWGCKQYRTNHEDLPVDFKLEDVELPQFVETETEKKQKELLADVGTISESLVAQKVDATELESRAAFLLGKQVEDEEAPELVEEKLEESPILSEEPVENQEVAEPVFEQEPEIFPAPPAPGNFPSPADLVSTADLFEIKEKPAEHKFGEPERVDFSMPMLNFDTRAAALSKEEKKVEEKAFDTTATLLPGFAPIKAPKIEDNGPSVTKSAQPMPVFEKEKEPIWKEPVEIKEQPMVTEDEDAPQQPDLLLDDLDSLFAQ